MSETFESGDPEGFEDGSPEGEGTPTGPASPPPGQGYGPAEAGPPTGQEPGSAPLAGGYQPPGGYPPNPPYWGYPPGGGWWGGPGWGPAAPVAQPSRGRSYRRPLAAAALVVGAVGLGAGIGIGHAVWSTGASSPTAATAPGSSPGGSGSTNPPFGSGGSNPFSGGGGSLGNGTGGAGRGGPSDAASIAAKVAPALVDINVTFDGQSPGAGTGIVLTSNGEVLTNNHVVEGATSISVTDVGNGKTYGAKVVGYDPTADVAVIQLAKASGLQTANIDKSPSLSVGQAVVAIGNAGGTGGTPTAAGGSITGLNQAITASDEVSGQSESLKGLIETNASVQPGDSGGSLVNTSGQVIGMDTAAAEGFSLSSQSNQGYAIPISKVLSIASQIEAGHGTATVHVGPTAFLGVLVSSGSSTSPYSGGYYQPYGGQNGSSAVSGADISGVVPGGPAAKAGLTQGDVITSLDGRGVSSASDLSSILRNYKPGQSVHVGWTDSSGATHTTTITLGSGPAQ